MPVSLFRSRAFAGTAALACALLCACSGHRAGNEGEAPGNGGATDMSDITMVPEDNDALRPVTAQDDPVPATDAWLGRWTGPEGLFLDIMPVPDAPGQYRLTMQDRLDRKADYPGQVRGDGIAFTRDGRGFVIRRGDGEDTGFTDLAGKHDCLIVAKGSEGYCR